MRMKTIADPRVKHPGFSLSDYIEVPAISTYGTFPIIDIIPFEQLAQLEILRQKLGGVK